MRRERALKALTRARKIALILGGAMEQASASEPQEVI
jgi:predicted GIY-YIG superfamily endonuclease